MENNPVFLNHKKYLSFTNLNKINSHSKKTQKKYNVFLSTNLLLSNIIINKKIVKNLRLNANNSPILIKKNNSNKLLNNNKSLKIFPSYKKIAKINLSKNININTRNNFLNKLFKYKINNQNSKNEKNNELCKDNFHYNYINKRFNHFFENKKIFFKTNIGIRVDCSALDCYENIYLDKNEKNETGIKINKSSKQSISSRKLNKESFRKEIYNIIKENKGKKKYKFKIIGRLKTEPNFN